MQIKVTQEHIDEGEKCSTYSCPISLALVDAGFCNIRVSWQTVKLGRVSVALPQEASDFIAKFDLSFPCQPFEFEFGYKTQLTSLQRFLYSIKSPIHLIRHLLRRFLCKSK